MNKLSAVSVFVALVACTGSIFATIELRRVSGNVSNLEDKLANLEKTTAPPTVATEPGKTSGEKAPATMSEMSTELVKLRRELAEVRMEQETGSGTDPAKLDPIKPRVASTDPSEVKKAVEDALAEKEKAQQAEDARRQAEWQDRRTKERLDSLATELGLTEQQKTQVGEILTKQSAAMRDAWQNRKEGEDARAKIDEIRKDTDTQVKALLSAEQQLKYDEFQKNQRGNGRGFGGGGRGNRGGGQGGGDNGGNK